MASDILIVDDEADIRDADRRHPAGRGLRHARGRRQRPGAGRDPRAPADPGRSSTSGCRAASSTGSQFSSSCAQDMPDLPVVMISGHGNIETAVAAIKIGAYDFIEKPFKSDRLLLVVERALEASRLKRENEELKQSAPDRDDRAGRRARMRQPAAPDDRAGRADRQPRPDHRRPRAPARRWRRACCTRARARAEAPFVVLNCAAITPGAARDRAVRRRGGRRAATQPRKVGTLEEAHGGTLFLDEVADMPLETQGKIVRVLQEQTFERVGGSARSRSMSASCPRPTAISQAEIAAGRFREDLYHRLAVVPMRVPPLARAARGHSGAGSPISWRDFGRRPDCRARDRRGRDGGAAGL